MRSRWALAIGTLAALSGVAAVMACSAFATAEDIPPGAEGGSGADAAATSDSAPGSDGSAGDAPRADPWVVLASGFEDLQGIAANETSVFFVERGPGKVYSVPLAGGVVQPVASNGASPSAIIAFDQAVVWADFGKATLTYLSLGGGVPQVAPVPAPVALVVATPSRYIVSSGTRLDEYDVPLTQKAGTTTTNAYDVAINDVGVFWTESSSASVYTGVLGSGAGALFAGGESGCESVAADTHGVYWTKPPKSVRGVLRSGTGSTAVDLATNEATPLSLASDDSGVYWLTTDGKLRSSSRNEAPLRTLAEGFASAFADRHVQAIALTKSYVVWITTDGRVLRQKKS